MTLEQIEEMGPVDYVVLEWPGRRQPTGEAAPLIVELVERGIIRILDVALMAKDEDGSVRTLDLGALDDDFAEFEGASTGLLDAEDLEEAAKALNPGTCAAVLVWENRWAAPSRLPCGAPAVSSSRAAASRSRPSSPRSRRSRPPPEHEGDTMPGLLRGVARTAVVAGTATAVSNRVSRRQTRRWSAQGSDPSGYEEPASEPEAPPAAAPDPIARLKELAALRDQGILTEEEFAAEKAKILAR